MVVLRLKPAPTVPLAKARGHRTTGPVRLSAEEQARLLLRKRTAFAHEKYECSRAPRAESKDKGNSKQIEKRGHAMLGLVTVPVAEHTRKVPAAGGDTPAGKAKRIPEQRRSGRPHHASSSRADMHPCMALIPLAGASL